MQPKLEDYIPADFPEIPEEISAEAREAHTLIGMGVPLSAVEGETIDLGDTARVLLPETRALVDAILPPEQAFVEFTRMRIYHDRDEIGDQLKAVRNGSVKLNLREELRKNLDIIDSIPPYSEQQAQDIRNAYARMEHLTHEYKELLLRKADRVVGLNNFHHLVALHKQLEPTVSASAFLNAFDAHYPAISDATRTIVERNLIIANHTAFDIPATIDMATCDAHRPALLERIRQHAPQVAPLFERIEAVDAAMSALHAELSTLSEGCQERLLPNADEQVKAAQALNITGNSRGL